MTAKEYNKIDNTFEVLENKTFEMCKKNKVNYYDYSGNFLNILMYKHIDNLALLDKMQTLDFNDLSKVKAILNKAFVESKENEMQNALKKLNESKINLFEWLDKTEEPYLFILNPYYQYGAGLDHISFFSKYYGYVKTRVSGTKNIDIAIDYLKYKCNL